MESSSRSEWLVLLLLASLTAAQYYDDIEKGVYSQRWMKIIRAAVNQTEADTLNLPSNATSIRENITDNFSCEGLIYGYYADMDNDCQVFHVCFPTQTSSGRNTTYRWSFICPQETVFNQEVLVCARPRDSIDCADSPMYYDKNKDFGKLMNETTNEDVEREMNEGNNINTQVERIKPHNNRRQVHKKPSNKRKQNIIVDNIYRRKKMSTENLKNNKDKDNNDNPVTVQGLGEKNIELEDLNLGVRENNSIRKTKRIKRNGLFRFERDAVVDIKI